MRKFCDSLGSLRSVLPFPPGYAWLPFRSKKTDSRAVFRAETTPINCTLRFASDHCTVLFRRIIRKSFLKHCQITMIKQVIILFEQKIIACQGRRKSEWTTEQEIIWGNIKHVLRFFFCSVTFMVRYFLFAVYLCCYQGFLSVLGTRFGSIELKIGSLESTKIIIGSQESKKSGPYRFIPGT